MAPYATPEELLADLDVIDDSLRRNPRLEMKDLDTRLAGSETTVTKYAAGCKAGGAAELWAITGGAHLPSLSPSFSSSVVDFLFAHPKP